MDMRTTQENEGYPGPRPAKNEDQDMPQDCKGLPEFKSYEANEAAIPPSRRKPYSFSVRCSVCGRKLKYHESYSVKPHTGKVVCTSCDVDMHVPQKNKEE